MIQKADHEQEDYPDRPDETEDERRDRLAEHDWENCQLKPNRLRRLKEFLNTVLVRDDMGVIKVYDVFIFAGFLIACAVLIYSKLNN